MLCSKVMGEQVLVRRMRVLLSQLCRISDGVMFVGWRMGAVGELVRVRYLLLMSNG